MTPAARVQTSIELVDAILVALGSADTIIADAFRARRYMGSSDRRAVRELVYRVIRAFGTPPPSGRAAFVTLADHDPELAGAFDGSNYGPAVIDAAEARAPRSAMPEWLGQLIDRDEHDALLQRAPLDLRANRLRTTQAEMLDAFPDAVAIGRDGLRLDPPVAIEAHSAFQNGLVEVQDHGSQLVAAACQARPGMTVVDLCAGAGGKTLALAADMAGEGRLVACDTDRTRLSKLTPRARKAGAEGEIRLLDGGREAAQLSDLEGAADVVLVDAPCSGTGTLRRNPEARWRLGPERLDALLETQRRVLALAAPLVKPGGVLVYAVCSLIEAEGVDQIAQFIAAQDDWQPEQPFDEGRAVGAGRSLTPKRDGCDGFFIARLRRTC